ADADTWFERQQQEDEMQRLQAKNRATMQVVEKLHRKKLHKSEKVKKMMTVGARMIQWQSQKH
ncbi:hypothetical protein FRX31_032331, partial [Thalictrum thalictroides]